jgi:C_GCAxxG_C_C family probable redox protein
MTQRETRALELFAQGDNCAQAVLKSCADLAGLTEHQAGLIAVGFGGGMGRMRQNCGAYSAAVMLCGALTGEEGDAQDKRAQVYALVQDVHREFVERLGTTCCAELLHRPAAQESPEPDARTAAYYASRPCAKIVLTACRIVEEHLTHPEEA